MKYIGELKPWHRDDLKALVTGTDIIDKLWAFDLDLEQVLRQLLDLWEEAEAIYKTGAHPFREYYHAAEKNKKADPLRFNICKQAIQHTHFLKAWDSKVDAQKFISGPKLFRYKPPLFKLLSNAGNPNWKKKVDVEMVVMKARELWERHGAERYHFKDRRGKGYPQVFLEDLQDALQEEGYDVKSLTTIRKRLRDGRFSMPLEAFLFRLH